MLNVYKASAGSGKTFQLVVEYLKLLFKNPNNYRHILAVTFTNKATNEMKSRILEQLFLLANNHPSDYLKHLKQENNLREENIRLRAKEILKRILHDYNRFSISTIDSFTQRVIKAFNRELGISPEFRVELDSDMILEEAVDRLFTRIGENRKLLKWLNEFSHEKISENLSQKIDTDIKSLGVELIKERFQLFFPDNAESVYSKEALDALDKEIQTIKNWFENRLKSKGEEALKVIVENALEENDFSGKSRGIASVFRKLANGEIPEITNNILESTENTDKWYTKTSTKKELIKSVVEKYLQPVLQDVVSFINNYQTRYYTALVVKKQLRMLGILTDLKEEIKLLVREKGILQISDSNLLLSKIIGQSESPFIYEKMGNIYRHFMLDEFQDTSTLQWHNFKPLLANSMAEGNTNLIVGDVKQSIYRWRNSDWNILAEQLYSDFRKSQLSEYSLEKNWRSDKNIITFNNALFKKLKSSFINYLVNEIGHDTEHHNKKFNSIYGSIKQQQAKPDSENRGFINIRFYDEDDFTEKSTSDLVEQVKQLQDKGFRASDIAILIRKNKEGIQIIEEFFSAANKQENGDYNFSILSNESLFLYSSNAIQFVITILEFITDPENEILKATLLHLWKSWLKPELHKKGYHVETLKKSSLLNSDPIHNWHLTEGFQNDFNRELKPQLEIVKEKILLSSLDEIITEIGSIFGLFNLESEIPFLQTLIDNAGELKSALSNDISNLIYWWNEKGYKTSVQVNEEVDSIRLLTVHKSKGLEFKAVLIPYLNWSTGWNNKTPVLWCKPKTDPFKRFPLLPVRANKIMMKSEFLNEYELERVNYFIDCLNLVYVAFTRAKSVIMVNCPVPKNNGTTRPVHFLIYKSLNELNNLTDFQNSWNVEKTNFRFGNFPVAKKTFIDSGSIQIKKYHFSHFHKKLRFREHAEDFLITAEGQTTAKNTGKQIHEILAQIITENDIEKACLNAFYRGIIDENEQQSVLKQIKDNLQLPEAKTWFDGSYSVVNERNIIENEKIYRPDRIMISGENAVVVDYKTGETKSENYNLQVKQYAKVLKETGYSNVTGFLWYIGLNEIEKVCEY